LPEKVFEEQGVIKELHNTYVRRPQHGGTMILDDLTFGTFREIEPNIMEIIIKVAKLRWSYGQVKVALLLNPGVMQY
jgi:hypothetical protein